MDHPLIPSGSLADWTEPLPQFQKDDLAVLLAQHSPEAVARLWLQAAGPSATHPFGGEKGSASVVDDFFNELRKLLCDDPSYEESRKQLIEAKAISREVCIAVVTGAIAAKIGLAASLLVPPAAIMLHVAGAVGVKAWCASCGR